MRQVVVWLPLVVALAAPGGATAGGHVPALPMSDAIPTLLWEHAVVPVDVDGDGADELLLLGREGTAQLYGGEGQLRWATSTLDAAAHGGLGLWERPSAFEGDFRGATGLTLCRTTAHGVAFADRTGDGHLDIVATSWMNLAEPAMEQRSHLIEIDGRTGAVLALHRFEGWVTNVVAAGGSEVFITEEDGPVEPPNIPGPDLQPGIIRLTRGTGGTTRFHRYDLDRAEAVWTHVTDRGWGQATAVATGDFAGSGVDLAVALTGPTGASKCAPESAGGPAGNDVLVVDGRSGALRWSVPAPRFVRQLVARPGEDGADVVLLSRGADASRVERLSGRDGASRWTAALPAGAVAWDLAAYGDDDVAVAYAAAAPAGTGHVPHAAVVDGPSGALRTTAASEPDPATINRMRLSVARLGAGDPDLVVRTDRHVAAVTAAGGVRWRRPSLDGAHVLAVTREQGGGERVWLQGPIRLDRLGPPSEINYSVEHGRYRLFGLDPGSGATQVAIHLVGPMLGLARADVDGDGVPDRIMGGASETVFAFAGGSQRPLWSRFLGDADVDVLLRGEERGNTVLGIELEDVDRDGKLDLVVQGHLSVHALRADDGSVLWSYGFGPTLGSGRWQGFELTDLDGDGVRDVVLGTSSARGGGHNLVEGAHVLALDGATGQVRWRYPLPPHLKRVNGLDVGDVDGDGVDDVAVAMDLFFVPGLLYSVMVLDGSTGLPLWQFDEHNGTAGGQHTTSMNALRMVDADGDGRADVAVLKMGSTSFDTLLRAHDGATGALLWQAPVVSATEGPAMPGWGLYRGVIDPARGETLLVGALARGSRRTFVQGFSPAGAPLFDLTLPPNMDEAAGMTFEMQVGDVTGDGFGDIVVPWLFGFHVIGGAGAARGEPAAVGHVADRRPGAARLVDVDGDGVLEIEAFHTPAHWPVHIGQVQATDLSGPVTKTAVFTVDLSPTSG